MKGINFIKLNSKKIIGLSIFMSLVLFFNILSAKKANICGISDFEQRHSQISKFDFLVIGHAYGIPKNKNFAKNFSKFLKKQNNEILAKVGFIFSGDVFHTPSNNKWKNFKKKFVKAEIAPGNHELNDISDIRSTKLDYQQKLEKSSFFKNFQTTYPLIVSKKFSEKLLVMLIDTNNPNVVSKIIDKIIELNFSEYEGLVMISHHVIDPELESYAHSIPNHFLSSEAIKQRKKIMTFLKKLSSTSKKKIWLISGDTGSNKEHDSLVCAFTTPYFISIVNGLGDKAGDKILGFLGTDLFYISLR